MRRIICAAFFAVLLPVVAQRSASQDVATANAANQARSALIARLVATEGIDKRIADAFDMVPRQRFLPAYLADMAYEDTSLPLGDGQTLPSPSDLLKAVQALDVRATDSVLVIGADAGYLAALLGHLAAKVFVVELVGSERVAERQIYTALGLTNITIAPGSSASSFATTAPFSRIFVHGATPKIPSTLLAQLGANGKLVVPLRDPTGFQMTVELSRSAGGITLAAIGKGFYAPIELGG